MPPLALEISDPAEKIQPAKNDSPPGQPGAEENPSMGTLAHVTRLMILIGIAVAMAYFARAVILPVLLAWIGSMVLKPPVRWLTRCRLPTPAAAAVVVSLFVVFLGFAAYWLGSPAVEWAKSAPETLPQLRQKFHGFLQPALRLSDAASSVGKLDVAPGGSKKEVQPVEVKDNHMVGAVFTWTGSLIGGIGVTIGLLFLLLACGETFVQKLVHIMPTRRDKKRVVEISREIQQSVSGYLFAVSLINVGLGTAVGVALWFLGMPRAPMWGAVAAFANFIPYLGPVMGMLAVGVAGLLAFDTFGSALLPVAAYFVLHLVEANFITPFALGRRFALNPVMIFIALIFCAWLWGVTGALLAVPLLVTFKAVCEHIPALSSTGEFLSR
jgi:predicted PurR-regulated permease PerM